MDQILCLADRPWSSSPGRTQQLMSRLKQADILYFSPENPTSEQKVRPNITICPLPTLPAVPHFLQEKLHFRGYYAAKAAARRRFRAPLLWTTHPSQVHLLDRIPHSGLVYDCARDFSALPGQWEGSLARAADVVFAASPELAHRLAPCSDNIAVVPNGVTFPLFSGASRVGPDRTARPLFGFAGTLSDDLDLSPILYAARQRPDWTFLLIGRDAGAPLLPQLRRLPNIRLAGPVPLTQVPDLLFRCHVLLEPLHLDQAYSGVVSTRMYEYLSTGRPIVSLLPPDLAEPFPDVVYTAHSDREFFTLCCHALEEAPDFVRARRISHGRSAAWALRAEEISRILGTAGLL